jgi:hypothetical protein
MIKSKIIYAWMLSVGMIQPMNDTHDDRDLYKLYVVNHDDEKLYVYEHVYKEEIIEYIETGDFEYESEVSKDLPHTNRID